MKCVRGLEVQALRSGAGYYLGTVCPDGSPNCRVSQGYARTKQEAEKMLRCDRQFADENMFCNGGFGCFRK